MQVIAQSSKKICVALSFEKWSDVGRCLFGIVMPLLNRNRCDVATILVATFSPFYVCQLKLGVLLIVFLPWPNRNRCLWYKRSNSFACFLLPALCIYSEHQQFIKMVQTSENVCLSTKEPFFCWNVEIFGQFGVVPPFHRNQCVISSS